MGTFSVLVTTVAAVVLGVPEPELGVFLAGSLGRLVAFSVAVAALVACSVLVARVGMAGVDVCLVIFSTASSISAFIFLMSSSRTSSTVSDERLTLYLHSLSQRSQSEHFGRAPSHYIQS